MLIWVCSEVNYFSCMFTRFIILLYLSYFDITFIKRGRVGFIRIYHCIILNKILVDALHEQAPMTKRRILPVQNLLMVRITNIAAK